MTGCARIPRITTSPTVYVSPARRSALHRPRWILPFATARPSPPSRPGTNSIDPSIDPPSIPSASPWRTTPPPEGSWLIGPPVGASAGSRRPVFGDALSRPAPGTASSPETTRGAASGAVAVEARSRASAVRPAQMRPAERQSSQCTRSCLCHLPPATERPLSVTGLATELVAERRSDVGLHVPEVSLLEPAFGDSERSERTVTYAASIDLIIFRPPR